MATKTKIGIIGTGNILGQYVRGTRAFEILDLVACADIDVPKAVARADEFEIPRACTVDELLADPAAYPRMEGQTNWHAGIIYEPVRDELFWAEKNQGAYLNRRRIRVSERSVMAEALLAETDPPDAVILYGDDQAAEDLARNLPSSASRSAVDANARSRSSPAMASPI